jgi:hypothetical protein
MRDLRGTPGALSWHCTAINMVFSSSSVSSVSSPSCRPQMDWLRAEDSFDSRLAAYCGRTVLALHRRHGATPLPDPPAHPRGAEELLLVG